MTIHTLESKAGYKYLSLQFLRKDVLNDCEECFESPRIHVIRHN